MQIEQAKLQELNQADIKKHQRSLEYVAGDLNDAEGVLKKLSAFNIAIPSWALGTGGTRFGRFSGGGEPRSLEEKIEDVGVIHALNRSSNSISLHIPWDIPENAASVKQLAAQHGLHFDAVNSNTFQDQKEQKHSYKFGSLHHTDKAVRKQAVEHNIEVIKYGVQLNSKALSVWLSDGSNFPGQLNFRNAFQNTLESLQEIYEALPDDWKVWVEYKPYEPNFYSTTIGDWGQSYLLASKLGPKAATLVDLGHHLQGTNIEQVVSLLLMENKLAGFHFNDSKYGDDDLTVGSINPYQLFLIFNELVEGMDARSMDHATGLGWMIDASHNVKDPIEDLLQSVQAIKIAYAQALIIDKAALTSAQKNNDVVLAQEILQTAYRTDVRPLVAEASLRNGGALDPVNAYRKLKVRENLISERGLNTVATGL
ncbi:MULTISPECIES: TIM barrel protein [unclassified Mucilaginibacter]|uniref:TIM barrel protein n=1 Tax=unclassified Mucilaginibacter TaxID=2617802 RepID=UPI002AC8B1A1|nr:MULTISPECIES: TIM barrel protein [unclassified Mucilaginibacter]MEB0248658.1 TIM barrel protein [Mucilaginibacter sp. 5B2]MEB0264107.1 TIM barrel protein [Mucilaginibacter sp. 10I4]MEB0279759.1 TIM barrel protein [Mucilaginibacter sp. 10B2]MEB0301618.1 TIM barrel protein [Mucilaginibacter sp. 5C4]WPX23683.1 TIM barrel protein [Mucilaginibacter sp. 5C4]